MFSESEYRTRKLRIDKLLVNAGWKVIRFREGMDISVLDQNAIEEYPTESGPADYLLVYKGAPLGVVEAKKISLGPQNVLIQAQRYARGVKEGPFNFGEYKIPFIYSTNGEIIWFQDLRETVSYSRIVSHFHTPFALREMLDHFKGPALEWLVNNPNDHPRLRPYQIEATKKIEEAIEAKKRQMLVAMATGTGKTFTIVSEIYRLMKAGYGKRILFLVDRRVLAAQAVGAFANFEPEPGMKFDKIYEVYSQRFKREDLGDDLKYDPKVLPEKYLTDPQAGHAFVYVCTIQRMRVNLFGWKDSFADNGGDVEDEADASILDIPIHAFDVIVADECHRGYTAVEISKWRAVLEHFDALKIGLTATPAAHTKAYFRDIVFRYDYEKAVQEGHLVDYDAVKVSSAVKMNGIFLKEGEEVGFVDTETGREKLDNLEDERAFDTADIEQRVTSPDSNKKIVEELKKYTDEQETETGRFPKTLIFAANDLPHMSHSDQLVRLCREIYGRGDDFAQKITGSPTVDRPLQRIREFRNRPNPGIVVTVDMLSTGVDIPALENIVFLRPVKSRILFEQMMGRGTRKCDEINKTHFTVFDCFDGTLLEYFRKASAFTLEPPEKPARSIIEIIESIYQNQDREYNVRCLVKRIQRIDKSVSAEGREQFARHIPEGDIKGYAKTLPQRIQQDFNASMTLLRDKAFQALLENYPRAKRVFVVAYETEDQVKSDYIFKTTDGRELKLDDYLKAFADYVEKNPDKIEAVRILLSKPEGWGTEALSELRKKLERAPENFTERKLRQAYHHELADIISMVKKGARKQNVLLSAQERVDMAIAQVKKEKSFSPEQLEWLGLIGEHLALNLAIEQKDFDYLPIFVRFGGWGKANKVFDGKLEDIIHLINKEVAAVS
ncbi:MAG: DEAD/DEAH box helicase family protein [Candidatus Margulisiibacteriota bacterium]